MDVFDTTIVNIAGPSIRADLGRGEGTVQWLSARAFTIGVDRRTCRARSRSADAFGFLASYSDGSDLPSHSPAKKDV
jgi:hypothetical protein